MIVRRGTTLVDEQAAVARLQQGDIGALEALVRQHQVAAIRAARLITRDGPLAEDLVQTAFLRAYERIDQFDAQRPFGPWFMRSVVNDAVKAVQRRARERPFGRPTGGGEGTWSASEAEAIVDPGAGPEDCLEQLETRAAVRAALDELTPLQRAAVVERYFLGRSEAEMMATLGCPRGTVKRRLYAARERLRLLLRPLGPASP